MSYFFVFDRLVGILSTTTHSLHVKGNSLLQDPPQPFVQSSFSAQSRDDNVPQCQRWAIVAPLDSEWASEAVCRQVRMSDWCLVIVFDREPLETYDTKWRSFASGEGGNTVVMHYANTSECEIRTEFKR